jgi:hypothetical protein
VQVWLGRNKMKFKVMLRRTGHHQYHYALTRRFPGVPETSEIITVRDIDGKLVQAIVHVAALEQCRSSGPAQGFIEASELELEA